MISTLDVARSAGLEVRRQGARWFTCCPLHGERTASLCFFPDGKWHCFGCNTSGDAADLFAALYGVTLGAALRAVRGTDWRPEPRKPDGHDLRRKVEAWKGARWREACEKKHIGRAIIKELERAAPDSDRFWQAVADEAAANDVLNLLDAATPRQFLGWMEAERDTIPDRANRV